MFLAKAQPRPAFTAKAAGRNGAQERILNAADRLLTQRSYGEITMEELASAAGVGKSTIYQYFQSKEDVVLSQVDRVVARVLERLERIASSGAAPATKIRQMLVARVMIRFEAVQHYTLSLAELLREVRPALLARRERYFREEAAVLARVILQGERAGVFRRQDAKETARSLITATNSLLPFSLSTREIGMPRTTEETAARIADLMLCGLATQQKAAGRAESSPAW